MTADDPTITIPVVSVTLADGNAIKAQLAQAAAVSMRIARAEGVLRDGAIDTLVVAHEWGHYISYRLIGDSNGLDHATRRAGWAKAGRTSTRCCCS